MSLKVICGADHAGFALKESLKLSLIEWRYQVEDCGTFSADHPVDYPDYTLAVVTALKKDQAAFGLLVCGSGIGMSIGANRHLGIRAALCHDVTTARLSRSHNDANILVLGERIIGSLIAQECLKVFLTTSFAGGRHQERIEKLG